VARYYLGLIHFRSGYTAGGTGEFVRVRELAADMRDDAMASNVRDAVNKVLAPFDLSRWFLAVSGIGQYDSNIAQISISAGAPSNKSTPKMMFTGLAGWQSAASAPVQAVFSYRGSINRNLNSLTRNYEFFSNVPTLFINFYPLNAITGGLKAEGSYTFQNQQRSGVFQPFSIAGDLSLFIKSDFNAETQLTGNVAVRTAKYYLDPGLDSSGYGADLALRRQTSYRFFNPGISLNYDSVPAQNAELRYRSVGAGFSNLARITGNDTLQMSLDFVTLNYADSFLGRSDKGGALRLNFTHYLSANLSILADFSYIHNISSLPETYSYDRFTSGLGLSWNR
jgi:hypothetical protein